MEGSGRRLEAIMFTDMVGYTALTQANESLAIEVLATHQRLIRPIFLKLRGREIKTIGDSFLIEFDSALDAINCAAEIQRFLHDYNLSSKQEWKIRLRIGIHLGDVIHTGKDVLGDAVNIASRIEPLAEPEGICVSEQVYDQVCNKTNLGMTSIGIHGLKNVERPVEVYRVELPSTAFQSSDQPASPNRIAVLPFSNISQDSQDEYFADGMTEELISTLSNIRELRVISRTSVMGYKGTKKKLIDIGRELRVGYAAEGSVRKAGNRIRISVQLIDVNSDEHLWARSYDRDLGDIFAIQSEIAQRVADVLKVQLVSSERRGIEKRATGSIEAYTLYLKGRYYWGERTVEGTRKALKYFEEAAKSDPEFALAYAGQADSYTILQDYGWMRPSEALPKAKSLAMKALEIDDTLAEAHASLGLILLWGDWDFASAEREIRRAIELKPNYATAHQWYATILAFTERFEESLDREKQAYELDPLSRVIGMNIGICLHLLGRLDEAIEQYQRVIDLYPDFPAVHSWLGMAYLQNSVLEKAIEEHEKAIALDPENSSWKSFLGFAYGMSGQVADAKRILGGLIEQSKRASLTSEIAAVLFSIGNNDEAFQWLERAYEERSSSLLYFNIFPWCERFRADQKWVTLKRKIGLRK